MRLVASVTTRRSVEPEPADGALRAWRRPIGRLQNGKNSARSPVSRLGSMGTPARAVARGRVVFLCCGGCTGALKRDPEKYLAKLPNLDSVTSIGCRDKYDRSHHHLFDPAPRRGHRAALVLAVLGALAAWETPVDAIPDLSENQVIVFTGWKGHGPREIEDQVTYPLSLGLSGLRGVRMVRSSSDVGFSMISVIFDEGIGTALKHGGASPTGWRVQAGLPDGVVSELAPDAPATGQIFWYTVEGGGLDLGRLRSIQDWYVRPQIASVPGVAEVASVGGFPTEYQISPDMNRLGLLGLSINDIVEAVQQSNAAAAGHVIHKGNAEYVVRGVGWLGASNRPGDDSFDQARALADLENVVVVRRRWRIRSAWAKWPRSASGPASGAACWKRTATR